MEEKVLECKGLFKKYGRKEVIHDVSFDVKKGDILGFIGPNGARKNYYYQVTFGTSQNG